MKMTVVSLLTCCSRSLLGYLAAVGIFATVSLAGAGTAQADADLSLLAGASNAGTRVTYDGSTLTGGESVPHGETVKYFVELRNDGPDAADGTTDPIVITLNYPATASIAPVFVPANTAFDAGAPGDGEATWTINRNLNPTAFTGLTANITLAGGAGPQTNTISAQIEPRAQLDPDPSDDVFSVEFVSDDPVDADLSVSSSSFEDLDSGSAITNGAGIPEQSVVVYRALIENLGPDDKPQAGNQVEPSFSEAITLALDVPAEMTWTGHAEVLYSELGHVEGGLTFTNFIDAFDSSTNTWTLSGPVASGETIEVIMHFVADTPATNVTLGGEITDPGAYVNDANGANDAYSITADNGSFTPADAADVDWTAPL
ncbi:MAG: hypothetical protein P8X61_12230, partial [Limibacillus sp.]